jgi:hypothetical protein
LDILEAREAGNSELVKKLLKETTAGERNDLVSGG